MCVCKFLTSNLYLGIYKNRSRISHFSDVIIRYTRSQRRIHRVSHSNFPAKFNSFFCRLYLVSTGLLVMRSQHDCDWGKERRENRSKCQISMRRWRRKRKRKIYFDEIVTFFRFAQHACRIVL